MIRQVRNIHGLMIIGIGIRMKSRIWDIPKMWKDQDCWIIGSGSSVPYEFGVPDSVIKRVVFDGESVTRYSEYMSFLNNKNVIAVNYSFRIGDFVDILFSGDAKFYPLIDNELKGFNGKVVTVSDFDRTIKNNENFLYLRRDERKRHGLSFLKSKLSWNITSGACAINLAVQLGVRRIFLLGFDLVGHPISGNTHFYNSWVNGGYRNQKQALRKRCFYNIDKDAKTIGVDIVNVSSFSIVPFFKKMTIPQIKKVYYGE